MIVLGNSYTVLTLVSMLNLVEPLEVLGLKLWAGMGADSKHKKKPLILFNSTYISIKDLILTNLDKPRIMLL